MEGSSPTQRTINIALSVVNAIPESHRQEMGLLIKDLEEAQATVFVRTSEARPMLERCFRAAEALKEAVEAQGWSDEAVSAFGDFKGAVSKLRNTILVRTQRAT